MISLREQWQNFAFLATIMVLLWGFTSITTDSTIPTVSSSRSDEWCPLPETASILASSDDGLKPSTKLTTEAYRKKQVDRLSAAVRHPTESFDDNGDVDTDSRWKTFDGFHETLRVLFPLIHREASLDKVNRYGLVFTLAGSSRDLKPAMLTAHQDVVPASSLSKWTHPPFEPYYDGQYVWGRGASDCKNNLIGVMSAVEALLEQDWKPRRTVVLAFGFDEETGGVRGAAKIAEELETMWGKDGLAMVLDEGGMGLTTVGDIVYARPSVAEKGYLDAVLSLETSGGHSSRPPPHSGIGIMAEMITALEQHPYQPILTRENPLRGYLECQARYTPSELEPWLRRGLEHDTDGKDIGQDLADARGPTVRFSMQTSQAVDIIRGGDKVNALPETVTATVNYRIAPHDSLSIVKSNIQSYLEPIAREHNITISSFNNVTKSHSSLEIRSSIPSAGTLHLSSQNDLAPSPITPTDLSNPAWGAFSATIRQVFETISTLEGKKVVPVGDIMLGNTDTLHYWNLTRNIYRFSPAREGTRFGVHTVDEHVEMQAHLEGLRFYYGEIRYSVIF